MMVSVMAEQQARQEVPQAATFAEQLKLVRQEREVKTELAPPAPLLPPAPSKINGGSFCTSCSQLVADTDLNFNEETYL